MHEKQEDCNARHDLKSKHDKEFKFKKAKAKTQETIKSAKHDVHEQQAEFINDEHQSKCKRSKAKEDVSQS